MEIEEIEEIEKRIKELEGEKRILLLEKEIEQLKRDIENLKCSGYTYPVYPYWPRNPYVEPNVTWTGYTTSSTGRAWDP